LQVGRMIAGERKCRTGAGFAEAVVIVDADERIRAFFAELDELITEGLVILDDVEVIKYVGRRRA